MRDERGKFIKGYKPIWSEKSRLKLSQSMRGRNTWSRGRKLTEGHKEKCRKNASRYWLGKKRPNLTGPLHPNWKIDKCPPSLYRAIRQTYKYKSWRLAVLRRDNFACLFCQTHDKLEVDHYPKRFVDLLKEYQIKDIDQAVNCTALWQIENGRTLCLLCHSATPTYGNNRNDIV